MNTRKAKKMSQVIFASCAASEGTLFRPEWGQFRCPQVEYSPPCSTKPPKEPALAPGDFHSSPRRLPFFEASPVKPVGLNLEATCRPGAAPPIAAFKRSPSPPSPEGSGKSGAPRRRSPLNRSKPARNSPARQWPLPPLQDRNPGAGSASRDRRRLGANLRLPLGTREILRLSQARATRKFSKKMGLFLVDFCCKSLSVIATSLSVPTATIYPHLVHMPLKTSQKPHPRSFLGSIFTSHNYIDLVVFKSDFFFLDL